MMELYEDGWGSIHIIPLLKVESVNLLFYLGEEEGDSSAHVYLFGDETGKPTYAVMGTWVEIEDFTRKIKKDIQKVYNNRWKFASLSLEEMQISLAEMQIKIDYLLEKGINDISTS